jgi:hypothetical protein
MNITVHLGAGSAQNSRMNLDSWRSIYGLAAPGVESSARINSRHSLERAKSDRTVQGGVFDALEV